MAKAEAEVDVQAKVEEAVRRVRGVRGVGTATQAPRTMTAAKAAIKSGRKGSSDAGALVYTTYTDVVYLSVPCGWCMTDTHQDCKPTLIWNNILYVCGCKVCVELVVGGLDEDAASVVRDAVESKSNRKSKAKEDDE